MKKIAHLFAVALLVWLPCAQGCLAEARGEGGAADPPAVAMLVLDMPPVHVGPRLFLEPTRQTLRSMVLGFYSSAAARFALVPSLPEDFAADLDAVPVVGSMRRHAGHRFNTEDGSSVDAFSICYRLSSRMGLQVIPGDAAPVKLAVTSLRNNTGVTVGMTWKFSRH